MKVAAPIAAILCSAASLANAATLTLGKNDDVQVPLPTERAQVFLSETDAKFARVPNTWSWISDVEHVVEESQKKLIFLADAKRPYYLCGDTIPAGREFDLFPYHYYDEWEVEQLKGRINYRMIAQNRTGAPIEVEITGQGFCTDWSNHVTWERAFRGEGARKFTMQPSEIVTLWEEKQLKGDLPWSGIVFGKTSGDLWVCDYAYLGENDPKVEYAQQMPDVSWPPYLLASFTRGSADWNAATIDLFPRQRNAEGKIELAALDSQVSTIAFGYSPGGPPTGYCYYKAVQPTFVKDVLEVKDPVSGYSHPFLGGNYTIMYRFDLPLINNTKTTKHVDFYLSSNDIFGVDSLVGVWINDEFLHRRVTMWPKNEHWKVFSIALEPGEEFSQPFTIVPLGSRWGGLVASVDVY